MQVIGTALVLCGVGGNGHVLPGTQSLTPAHTGMLSVIQSTTKGTRSVHTWLLPQEGPSPKVRWQVPKEGLCSSILNMAPNSEPSVKIVPLCLAPPASFSKQTPFVGSRWSGCI